MRTFASHRGKRDCGASVFAYVFKCARLCPERPVSDQPAHTGKRTPAGPPAEPAPQHGHGRRAYTYFTARRCLQRTRMAAAASARQPCSAWSWRQLWPRNSCTSRGVGRPRRRWRAAARDQRSGLRRIRAFWVRVCASRRTDGPQQIWGECAEI
jgi:hypothetical protein